MSCAYLWILLFFGIYKVEGEGDSLYPPSDMILLPASLDQFGEYLANLHIHLDTQCFLLNITDIYRFRNLEGLVYIGEEIGYQRTKKSNVRMKITPGINGRWAFGVGYIETQNAVSSLRGVFHNEYQMWTFDKLGRLKYFDSKPINKLDSSYTIDLRIRSKGLTAIVDIYFSNDLDASHVELQGVTNKLYPFIVLESTTATAAWCQMAGLYVSNEEGRSTPLIYDQAEISPVVQYGIENVPHMIYWLKTQKLDRSEALYHVEIEIEGPRDTGVLIGFAETINSARGESLKFMRGIFFDGARITYHTEFGLKQKANTIFRARCRYYQKDGEHKFEFEAHESRLISQKSNSVTVVGDQNVYYATAPVFPPHMSKPITPVILTQGVVGTITVSKEQSSRPLIIPLGFFISVCSSNADCKDGQECDSDYTGIGKCRDIDECQEVDICAATQFCRNIDDGYVCDFCDSTLQTACPHGMLCRLKSGHTSYKCFDIDECNETEGLCGEDMYCRNTEGSYVCDTCSSDSHCSEREICIEDISDIRKVKRCFANPCDVNSCGRTATCRATGPNSVQCDECADSEECGIGKVCVASTQGTVCITDLCRENVCQNGHSCVPFLSGTQTATYRCDECAPNVDGYCKQTQTCAFFGSGDDAKYTCTDLRRVVFDESRREELSDLVERILRERERINRLKIEQIQLEGSHTTKIVETVLPGLVRTINTEIINEIEDETTDSAAVGLAAGIAGAFALLCGFAYWFFSKSDPKPDFLGDIENDLRLRYNRYDSARLETGSSEEYQGPGASQEW